MGSVLAAGALTFATFGVNAESIGAAPAASKLIAQSEVDFFVSVTPTRLLDTRSGVGVARAGPIGPGGSITVQVSGVAGIPAEATSVSLNTAYPAVATSPSFMTIWPTGTERPFTAANNATPGQAVPNFTIAKLGEGGAIDVFNERGDAHVVLDVVGYTVPLLSVEVDVPGGVLWSGSTDPSSALGNNDDFYVNQATGEMFGPKINGEWDQPIAELGGGEPHVISAAGAPGAGVGSEGDAYIDLTKLEIYGPKSGDNWGTPRPLGSTSVGTGSSFLSGDNAPAASLGSDGDLYLDRIGVKLFGPKTAGSWGAGVDVGPDGAGGGASFLVGSTAPGAALGANGDTYLDESDLKIYGPKSDAGWGGPVSIGPDGVGSTFLTGTGAPGVSVGANGDTYLDEVGLMIYGPKTGAGWGVGVAVGPDGVGSTFLTGTGGPLPALGANGDTYLDKTGLMIYGPKSGAGWGVGVAVGPDGVGSTFLTGTGGPLPALGANGDTYLDTDAMDIYGPKVGTVWGPGVSLDVGARVLVGTTGPAPGLGVVGDLYLDTDDIRLYGPKDGLGWGLGTDISGAPTANTDAAFGAFSQSTLLSVSIGSSVIPFDENGGVVSNVITRVDDNTFSVTKTGTYKVSYDVALANLSILGNVQIWVNGAQAPNTPSRSLLALGVPVSGMAIVHATAGQTIEIVATGIGVSAGAHATGDLAIELIAVD